MDHNDFAKSVERIVGNVGRAVSGKREGVFLAVVAMLAGGHILIEDVPGVGKTLLAKSLARSLQAEFRRIQFTPDLLPADVTGLNVYNQGDGDFEFWAGPVFANVVLADEINRASPKTQSALLEAMEEGSVTVDGVTRDLAQPFCVIATQNPVEHEGTYPLPHAELDRFMIKMQVGYPDEVAETEMLKLSQYPVADLSPVVGVEEFLADAACGGGDLHQRGRIEVRGLRDLGHPRARGRLSRRLPARQQDAAGGLQGEGGGERALVLRA